MNKTEALEAVRFLRNSLFNTDVVNMLLDQLELYILTHDAEVIRQTLNGIYGVPDETKIVNVPIEITCSNHLEEVER